METNNKMGNITSNTVVQINGHRIRIKDDEDDIDISTNEEALAGCLGCLAVLLMPAFVIGAIYLVIKLIGMFFA